jgi:hypothetical protein
LPAVVNGKVERAAAVLPAIAPTAKDYERQLRMEQDKFRSRHDGHVAAASLDASRLRQPSRDGPAHPSAFFCTKALKHRH